MDMNSAKRNDQTIGLAATAEGRVAQSVVVGGPNVEDISPQSTATPVLSEEEALRQVEETVYRYVVGREPAELQRIINFLTFATQVPELVLNRNAILSPTLLQNLPEAVWEAMNVLGVSQEGSIRTVCFPLGMERLPFGVWKLPALEHVELPGYSGTYLNLRDMPKSDRQIRLDLKGATSLRSIHLRQGSPLPVLLHYSDPVTVYFYDEKNYATSVGQINVGAPVSRQDNMLQPSAFKVELPFANDVVRIAKLKEVGSVSLGKQLCEAFEKGDAKQVFYCTSAILSLDLSGDAKQALLVATLPNEYSGLGFALKNGHVDVVKSYMLAIRDADLDEINKTILFRAKKMRGWGGIRRAFHSRHPETVRIYTYLVLTSSLPIDKKISLVEGRCSIAPCLSDAFKERGNAEVIVAFSEAVLKSEIDEEHMFQLLKSMDTKGNPGFYYETDDLNTIESFTRLILASSLTPLQKCKLLEGKPKDIGSNVCRAYQLMICKSPPETAAAFVNLILSSSLPNEHKFRIVEARIRSAPSNWDSSLMLDTSAFSYLLLTARHEDAVGKLSRLILDSTLSNDMKFRYLEARSMSKSGFSSGLYTAFREGHHQTIAAFCQNVLNSSLAINQKLELLACDAEDSYGFEAALLVGHHETVQIFGRIVLDYSFTSAQKMWLLGGVTNALPPFHSAMKKSDYRVVKVFIALIASSNLTENEKIFMLNAADQSGQSALDALLDRNGQNDLTMIDTFRTAVRSSSLSNQAKKLLNSLPGDLN